MIRRSNRVAEELEALLEGRVPADDVGREAQRLASLATHVAEERPGATATLTAESRAAIRDRVMSEIAQLDAPLVERVATEARPRVRRASRSARTAIASGLASTMIAGTGMAVAAQDALPGDMLYGLKKGTESVRMSLASDATQAARLELRFAEERLEEITAGVHRLRSESMVDALAEMDRRSVAGAEQLVLIAERTGEDELLAELDEFVERQTAGVVAVFTRLPIEVRPHAEDSLATLQRIRAELLLPAAEACECLDVVTASHSSSPVGGASDSLPPRTPTATEASTSDEEAAEEAESSRLREPIENITGGERSGSDSDGISTTLSDPVGETVDRTTETVGDLLDSGGDAVDKTTDKVNDTVDKTTDTVNDTVDETTDKVNDTVDETTDSLGRILGD